jgi:hypothetical protein
MKVADAIHRDGERGISVDAQIGRVCTKSSAKWHTLRDQFGTN